MKIQRAKMNFLTHWVLGEIMKNAYIQNNKAYIYAKDCIKSKEAPKYVKKQCKKFIEIADGKNKKYCINEEKVKQIENVLKLLILKI